jgi:hypothetical protein
MPEGRMALEKLIEAWCKLMHSSPMWPAHGRYECRTCGRHYLVPWAETRPQPRRASRVHSLTVPSPSLR